MEFGNTNASVLIPDGTVEEAALARTTHLGVGAHQDDLEIMAFDGILRCFGRSDQWFCGVTVTDGGGSPRDGIYADYTDDDMKRVRAGEQNKAAVVGEYAAQVQLGYASSQVKDSANVNVVADLASILEVTRPDIVYTHNLADKHDTHVAVAGRLVTAIRRLDGDARPKRLLGCEVWRDLDWMVDADKACMNVEGHENLAAALIGVYDSQIAGGKRYDLATMGRRRANATYHASHGLDETTALVFAMDLMPLIEDDGLDIAGYAAAHIDRFRADVIARLSKLV